MSHPVKQAEHQVSAEPTLCDVFREASFCKHNNSMNTCTGQHHAIHCNGPVINLPILKLLFETVSINNGP